MTNILSNPEDFDEYEDAGLYHECPNCGRQYDAIDFEFQTCHFCWFDASSVKDTDGI